MFLNILILTNNKNYWINILTEKILFDRIINRKNEYILYNNIIKFIITNESNIIRGNKYSCVILDKYIDNNILENYIYPSSIQNIIKTNNYWSNK